MIGAASISAIDSIDLRAKLVETAGIEGVRPMELAAQLVSQIQDADKQDTARFIVQSSFPKPEERIEFAKALPAGRTRSFAFAGLFDHYSRNLDWAGLTHLYQSVPLGKDRTQLSAQTLQLILDKQGVERALEYIEGLEMPEERRAAGMKLLSSGEAKKTSSDKVLYEKVMDLRRSLNLPGDRK